MTCVLVNIRKKILRLGVSSLICPFYIEDEEWIDKKIILQKNKIYFFKHWENVKVYLQYIIHIHILKRIQKFADKLCFSFSVTLPKLVSRTYIYIYIYIYPHTTYTCFVLPRTHQCGSVNDERTTDVTRLLKAPGAEVCQSAYELCKYI